MGAVSRSHDPRWRRYLRFLGPDPRADVNDELQFHWEELMRRYRAEGMDEAAAAHAAREQFGDVDDVRRSLSDHSARRHLREERSRWWNDVRRDLRVAARRLVHQPAFTAAAVATLALGIGANAAVFSVVNSALLRPLPYPGADRIVDLREFVKGRTFCVSSPNFNDWRDQTRSYAGLAAYNAFPRTLTGDLDPQSVPSAAVTGDFFQVMGVAPARGRPFTSAEQSYPAADVALISDGLWRSTFGARGDIVGRTAQFDGRSFQIVGVMPPGFDFPTGSMVWTPLAFSSHELTTQRGGHYLGVVARLRAGTTVPTADRELSAIAGRLALAYPASSKGNGAMVRSLRDALVGASPRRALLVLLGAVGLVALIACANVANLLLARGAARQRELAVRTALGARPGDLIGMALTESLLLALLGGAAGVVVAWAATRGLDRLRPEELRSLGAASVDLTVLAFTLGLSLATGLLFGLAPGLQAARLANVHGTLQAGGRAEMIGKEGWRIRSGLVAAELALAVTLLAGAGLLIRSFNGLRNVDPGFQTSGVVTYWLSLPFAKYHTDEQVEQFYRQLLVEMRAMPGVERASAITNLPLDEGAYSISTYSVDGVHIEPSEQPSTQVRVVNAGLIEALHMHLLRGRTFTDADRYGAPNAVMMNQSAARLLFPNQDPVGHELQISMNYDSTRGRVGGRVVGLLDDIHDETLSSAPRPTLYFSQDQFPFSDMTVVVRTAAGADPMSVVAAARARLRTLDPNLPMSYVRTFDQIASTSIAQQRFAMLLLAAFAGVALTLAAVGIFGVMSYIVGQRTREIGVRMALGASGGAVVGEAVRRAMTPVFIGELIGIAGALVLTRTMVSLLYGVTPGDPVTFGVVAVGLAAIAAAAAWLPARRASRIDPVIALRND